MDRITPSRPNNLDPLAREMLEQLAETPAAEHVVVGGGVALNCYAPPRLTRDLDAWWAQTSTPPQRDAAIGALRAIAAAVGRAHDLTVYERPPSSSGVVSVELQDAAPSGGRRTVFAFQLAPRDLELEPPYVDESPFAPVAVESLRDNLASKMVALVSRGAPRDFQDVFRVVDAGIASPSQLWELFALKAPLQDVAIAKAEVLHRLADIELRRPLDTVPAERREEVERLRTWVREELTGPARDRARELGLGDAGLEL